MAKAVDGRATGQVIRMSGATTHHSARVLESLDLKEAIMARDIALLLAVLAATRQPRRAARKAA